MWVVVKHKYCEPKKKISVLKAILVVLGALRMVSAFGSLFSIVHCKCRVQLFGRNLLKLKPHTWWPVINRS